MIRFTLKRVTILAILFISYWLLFGTKSLIYLKA